MSKRILITGASRGIGRAIARRLADDGVTLILHGRDRAALEETSKLVTVSGGEAVIAPADLADSTSVDRLADTAGTVDAIVHNAGISVVAPVEELTPEQWQAVLAVNVTAPFLLTRRLLPTMIAGGSIVHILSVANKAAFPHWSAYTMSKAALEGFGRCLREEVRGRGIRVIDIYAAATATDLWQSVPGEWSLDKMMPPDEVAEAVAYALSRPPEVLVDSISVGGVGGSL